VPYFVLAFVVFVALNSFGFIPIAMIAFSTELSRWALLTAIAAVGLKTSLKDVIDVGSAAIALLVMETTFIGGFTIAGLYWIGL
jgi:uncharacterized membrane protein YadS